MKKLFFLAAVCLMGMASAVAQIPPSVFNDPAATKPLPVQQVSATSRVTMSESDPTTLGQQTAVATPKTHRAPAAKDVTAADVPEQALQIDNTSGATFLHARSVTATLTGSKLAIKNFGGYGLTVTADVDLATGAISIPRQAAYQSATYGQCDIVHLNDGLQSYDTTAVIAGQIAGGQVTIGPWVLYITSGDYKGYVLGNAIESSTLRAVNATMNVAQIDTNGVSHNYSYPIIAEQTAKNKVVVTNFAGVGAKIDIDIKGDSSLAIYPQLALSINGTGNFWVHPYDPATNLISGHQPVVGTTTGGKLAWGGSILATSTGTYVARYSSSEISLPFTLQYPAAATQAGWKGSGTEADPWLIETPADLIALSDSVNYGTPINVNVGARAGQVARAFEGKYFKVTKYINMSGIVFNPIGGLDETYRFGGTFDGGSKSISNLTVNVGYGYNAGLFGAADTTSVIKNVNLYNPKVTGTYFFTGGVVGYSQGTVENCTVTNPVINGVWVCGGVAAIAGHASKLTVTGGKITGDSQTGGVLGVTRNDASELVATNTTVTCFSTTETSSAGGVVGYFGENGRYSTLSDCYFSGDVVATKNGEFVGGISGVNTRGNFVRCFSTAQVVSTSSSFSTGSYGGIVGATQDGNFTDCLFTGEIVPKSYRVGSIVGYVIVIKTDSTQADHITLTNCLVSGINQTTTSQQWAPYAGYFDAAPNRSMNAGANPIVTVNSYYDEQMLPTIATKLGAKKTSELTQATGIEGFADSVWTFTAGQYPALKKWATTTVGRVASAVIALADTVQTTKTVTSDFTGNAGSGITWQLLNGGARGTQGHSLSVIDKKTYHLNGVIGTDTVVIYSSSAVRYLIVNVAPANLFEGDGTAESPYLIKNKQDLITLSNATFNNKMSFDGVHFLITNDIDVEGDQDFNGIAIKGSSQSSTLSFGGILDGGNHTIHGIKMIRCYEENGNLIGGSSTNSYSGFVNALKANGTVKNVRIGKDCVFEFYSRSGAVVGYNHGGKILNCRNYADVKAHSGTIGGITGCNNKPGVISGCYNSGRIWTSYQYAAGIAAQNYGVIENCQNDGEIMAKSFDEYYSSNSANSAGGICEATLSDGVIKNCLNTGYVHAPKYVGGILAWHNGNKGNTPLENCISTGQVSYNQVYSTDNVYLDSTLKDATIGNMIGKIYQNDVHFTGNYYDAQQNIYNASYNKAAEGINGVGTELLTSGQVLPGYDTAYWQFTKGQYPVLKAFADEPGSIAGAHSVVWFDGSVRCDSVKRDSRLGSNSGLTWTLKSGNDAFKVVDGVLSMDPAPVLTDTLYATYGGFVKHYIVTAVPDTVPAPAISVDGNVATFTDALEGVTYFFTTDGTTPTRSSKSSTGEATLPEGQLKIQAIASKHNYYDSPVTEVNVLVSGISNISDEAKEIGSRYYVTPDGRMSSTPVQGINVVVTRYTDGSTSVHKAIVK